VEILIEMSRGYFIARSLNRSFIDVPPHVRAGVCPLPGDPPLVPLPTAHIRSNIHTYGRPIHRRQRYFDRKTLRLETTSIRIPLLSP
jgi:hypothetical protein